MVLRFLFRMVLNFQIVIFTKFLQTSVLFECLVLSHCGHAEKPNPSPGCCGVSEWLFLHLYFDHTDSVVSKIKRFKLTRCELSGCVQWALLKIAEVATVDRLHHWEYPI